MLDHELFLELQLPAKSGPNCKDPTLGLGFTFAITSAASAFLTSAASSNDLFDAALGDQTPHGLTTYEAAQQAYETWSAQCEQQSVLPFQAFTGERPPKQHQITALVHQKKVQEKAPGSARTRIMRSSMKLQEPRTWANCSRSTDSTASPFQGLVAILLPSAIFSARTRCQRPQFASVMDTYGDHLLYCERGPHRIRRHDAQVKLLVRDLAKAARHPVVEERPVGRHRKRADIRALGRSGETELFDVTILPPSQPGKDPGHGRKSAESVEGCMDCQSFQILRHAKCGRDRVQIATCPVVNTRELVPGRS